MRNRLPAIGAALISAGLPIFAGSAPPSVRAIRAERRSASTSFTADSSLMVEREVSVSSRISGIIDVIQADRGQFIQKGKALATLDQREFELDRRAAEAAFAAGEADFKRYEELYRQKLASSAELEQRRARYEEAKVDLEKARLVIDRSVIRAPFDGVVVDRFARVGQKVLADDSAPLFKISALGPLLARAYLSESWLGQLRVGETISVVSAEFPDVRSTGRISFLSPVLDPASRSFQVIVSVASDRGRIFRPGTSVRLSFPRRTAASVALPSSCVLGKVAGHSGEGTVLEIVSGRVRSRKIAWSSGETGWVEVRAGLAEGAWIVANPTEALRDGTEVNMVR